MFQSQIQGDDLEGVSHGQLVALLNAKASQLQNGATASETELYDQASSEAQLRDAGRRFAACKPSPPRRSGPKKKGEPVILQSGMTVPIGTAPRMSLYRAKIELDDFGTRMNLDLLKDNKKMYIVVTDPVSHIKKEMELYMK